MKNLILNLDNVPSSSRNRRNIKDSVAQMAANIAANERWLLCALLGCNGDASLFDEKNAQERWRGRDYLYELMTEKDIQSRLATELSKNTKCPVHVEVPIYGKSNRRGRRKSKPYNIRPDVLLLSSRKRERRLDAHERHLEVSAVEIKYFGKRETPPVRRWIARAIRRDLKKLRICTNSKVQPKANNGYFLCVDESASGNASQILEKHMRLTKMKHKRIGYFVLKPTYVAERRTYPMYLEQHEPGLERCSFYVMDKALGKLKQTFLAMRRESVHRDDYSGSSWFFLRGNKKRTGWVELDWKFRQGKKSRAAVIVRMYDENHRPKYGRPVKWDEERDGYQQVRKSVCRLCLLKSRSYRKSLKRMDRTADDIYRFLKKVVKRSSGKL